MYLTLAHETHAYVDRASALHIRRGLAWIFRNGSIATLSGVELDLVWN